MIDRSSILSLLKEIVGLLSLIPELARSLWHTITAIGGSRKRGSSRSEIPKADREIRIRMIEPGSVKIPTSWSLDKNHLDHVRLNLDYIKADKICAYTTRKVENVFASSATEEPSGNRYLNAGFFTSGGEALSTDLPIALDGGPYKLGVNIGKFWGPGRPGNAFPDMLLQPFFRDTPVIELDVAISSPSIKITPQTSKLKLTQADDSPLQFFDVELFETGRQSVSIDLQFRGHLLQSRRLEFEVVSRAGDEVARSAWPVQDGYIVFTRTEKLTAANLKPLEESPRLLTIVAERAINYNSIGLRFYDHSRTDLGFRRSNLNDTNLTKLLDAIRKQLLAVMGAYAGNIGGSRDKLTIYLGMLADIGRHFYLALMPEAVNSDGQESTEPLSQIKLDPGTVIQVAPLSTQLGVPWELLYERPFGSFHEDRTRLCPDYETHGPRAEDCKSYGDVSVVCPYGFWGYSYIIEQLPLWIDPHKPPSEQGPPLRLPLEIKNGLPLRLSVNVATTLNRTDSHIESLRKLANESRLTLARAETYSAVREAMVDAQPPADVIYFYAHGGEEDSGAPYLEVGRKDRIKIIDLDAWKLKLNHQPLIVLNACESASYSPASFESLLSFFCQSGAAGVIGTQCDVKEVLADSCMLGFFASFLRTVPAGEALFTMRQELLRKGDPRGLVYSLFASADVRLAEKIIE